VGRLKGNGDTERENENRTWTKERRKEASGGERPFFMRGCRDLQRKDHRYGIETAG